MTRERASFVTSIGPSPVRGFIAAMVGTPCELADGCVKRGISISQNQPEVKSRDLHAQKRGEALLSAIDDCKN